MRGRSLRRVLQVAKVGVVAILWLAALFLLFCGAVRDEPQRPDPEKVAGTTSAALADAFATYSQLYFADRLPHVTLVGWSADLGEEPAVAIFDPATKQYAIFINDRLEWSPELARLMLLHEMVHVAHWDYHDDDDPRFQQEMLRLANRGALKGLW